MVAPLSGNQNQAISLIRNQAQGTPLQGNMARQISGTINGNFLGKGAFQNAMAGQDNPYLQNVINSTATDTTRAFQNAVMPQTDANFARSGAFGGSAWEQANADNSRQLAGQLANQIGQLRYGDFNAQRDLAENYANRQTAAYDAERGRQQNAVGQGLQFSGLRDAQMQALLAAGGLQNQHQQAIDNAKHQQFLDRQNWPVNNLDIYRNAYATAVGGQGTTTQGNSGSGVGGAISGGLGGAASGAAIGSIIPGIGTGIGAAVGGGLGLLGGLF